MVYYKKKDYILYGFEKSKVKNKKYNALIVGKDKRIIRIAFGDKRYENFHDKTGLNKFPKLLHGDKKRRSLYRKRHKRFLRKGYYSPGYFSYYYLW